MNRRSPGRKDGKLDTPASTSVTGIAAPPLADTRLMPPAPRLPNRIVPSELQAPDPTGLPASHKTCGGPPAMAIFFT